MDLFERNAPTLFTPQRAAKEASRARKMESVYHVGQQKIWDGRDVLQEAFKRFPGTPGQERIPAQQRHALAKVFSMLMWGELAAWRVSLQLAEMLPEPEARLAATSQAHDEARHYYVLHDYLEKLGVEVPPLDPYSRIFLNACLKAPLAVQKMVGMQLLVETIALTIFKMVREMNVDPALSYMLTFYEKDEARHVGFGVQAVPALVAAAGVTGRARVLAFEVKVLSAMLMALKNVEGELRLLGADPRAVLEDGARRFAGILDAYRAEAGGTTPEGRMLGRLFDGAMEAVFPVGGDQDWWSRAAKTWRAMQKESSSLSGNAAS